MIEVYLVGFLMFLAFYAGVYSDKKMSSKIKIIALVVSIFWPLAIVYVVLGKPISKLINNTQTKRDKQ